MWNAAPPTDMIRHVTTEPITTRRGLSLPALKKGKHMAQHTRAGCPERLTETFWLPSYCRGCLAAVSDRLDAMTDAEAVSWPDKGTPD